MIGNVIMITLVEIRNMYNTDLKSFGIENGKVDPN